MKLVTETPPTDPTLELVAETRGITVATLEAAGVRVADDGWIELPYRTLSGKEWYVKRRNPDPKGKPKYLPDRRNHGVHLYNPFGYGPNVDEVWFVEGEFDALALADIGVPAVAYPGAAAAAGGDDEGGRFRIEWFRLFEYAFAVAAAEADVELAKVAVRRIQAAWSPRSARFDPAEGGFKDVNEWLKEDREGFVDAVGVFRREHGLA